MAGQALRSGTSRAANFGDPRTTFTGTPTAAGSAAPATSATTSGSTSRFPTIRRSTQCGGHGPCPRRPQHCRRLRSRLRHPVLASRPRRPHRATRHRIQDHPRSSPEELRARAFRRRWTRRNARARSSSGLDRGCLECDDALPGVDGGDEMPVLGGEAGSGVDGQVAAAEDTGRAAPHWVDRRIVGNRDVDPEVVAEVAGAAEPDGCGRARERRARIAEVGAHGMCLIEGLDRPCVAGRGRGRGVGGNRLDTDAHRLVR